MGNGMNKIMNGLYLGNFRDSRDEAQLSQNKITHILSIHDNAKPQRDDKVYLCLNASDSPVQDLSQYFKQCNDFIHKARLDGGSVLVHCLAGVSRSATIVIAYVMSVTNLNYRQALDAVRGARRCASPNFGFQRQLVMFEIDNLEQERQRLQTAYSEPASMLEQDRFDCKILIDVANESDARISRARCEHFVSVSDTTATSQPQRPVMASPDAAPAASSEAAACTAAGPKPDLSCSNMRNMLEELVTVANIGKDHDCDDGAVQDAQVSSTCDDDGGCDSFCKTVPMSASEDTVHRSSVDRYRAGAVAGQDVACIDAGDGDDNDPLVNKTGEGISVEC